MKLAINRIPIPIINLALIIAISIAGGAAAIYGTANGPWGYSDSAAYISQSRYLLDGVGMRFYSVDHELHYQSHYPPFYSLALAGIGWAGVDLIDAARWLNILCYVATIFGAGWILARFSSRPVMAIPASLLIGLFPAAAMMFTSSMSEPLFVCQLVWGGYCLLEYLDQRDKRWLVASALVIGLLPVTRYIGISILFSAVAAVLIFTPGRWYERMRRTAIFGFLASLPILAWSGWVVLGASQAIAGRRIGIDMSSLATHFKEFRALFLDTIWFWLPLTKYPSGLAYWLRYLLLGLSATAVMGLTLWAHNRITKSSQTDRPSSDLRIFWIFGLSALFYVITLAITYLFSLPTPDVNDRMLLPIFPCVLLSFLAALALWDGTITLKGSAWRQGGLLVVTLLIGVWYFPQTFGYLKRFHRGEGTTAYRWRTSETMQAVRNLPQELSVVSNDAAAILAWTNRPGYPMMEILDADFVAATSPYGSSTTDVAQVAFCQQRAALVIFGNFPQQLEMIYGAAGRQRASTIVTGLVLYREYRDGSIYFCPK